MEKTKKTLLIFLIILLVVMILVGFTYVLAIMVSTPHSVLRKFAIDNFQPTNDWIGF